MESAQGCPQAHQTPAELALGEHRNLGAGLPYAVRQNGIPGRLERPAKAFVLE
jgi:hypothetical protein